MQLRSLHAVSPSLSRCLSSLLLPHQQSGACAPRSAARCRSGSWTAPPSKVAPARTAAAAAAAADEWRQRRGTKTPTLASAPSSVTRQHSLLSVCRCERTRTSSATTYLSGSRTRRNLHTDNMAPPLQVELTAPNGVAYTQPTGLWINNEWRAARSGEKIASINPSNEEEIATVEAAGPEDVDDAVAAARAAFEHASWRDLSGSERGGLMLRLADLAQQHASTLATIETWDNGKPYRDSLDGDVAEVVATLRYYAGYADKIHGQVIDTGPNKLAYTLREPVGVCGQIIPWNYPLAMAAWKLGPALACGNTVILKPAEQTPLSILYFANLIKEAGFPPGVVNILNGHGRVAGATIASHVGIDKIAFTGSTNTGREIMKLASANLKNITLETGGKSPLLVFDDADLEQAVKWSHVGIMSNQGQICTATSRILVQEGVYDAFVEKFKAHMATASVVGDPFKDETFQGPQVTKAQYDRVLGYIEKGKSEGATLVSGGEPVKDVSGRGFFIAPTIFTNVKDSMTIYREEVFGPFVVISSFKSDDEAVRRANDSTYGLGSAIFTRDITKAHRVARRIEAGMVWINSSNDSDIRVPFGGVKMSGVGRELGEAGLEAYSQKKAVHVNLGNWL